MFFPLGADSDVRPTTVALQPKPGIGDMIWQLPTLKALAANDPTGRIDLIVHEKLPAQALLGNEGYINRVFPLCMRKSLTARIRVCADLLSALPPRHYRQMFVLHHSCRYALAARLTGIPHVYGWGLGAQRFLLTQPRTLMPSHYATPKFTLDLGRMLLDRLHITYDDGQPHLSAKPDLVEEMRRAFAGFAQPWIGIGIGSTEASRIWPSERFAAICDLLWQAGYRSLYLLGAPHERVLAEQIIAECRVAKPLAVVDRPLDQVIALMLQCEFNFCTDSGLMNVSAALGVPVYVLFSTVVPYTFSSALRPIVPTDGVDPQLGARKITVEDAVAALRRDGVL